MNKRTCDAIKFVIENRYNYDEKNIRITLDDSKAHGLGFWKMKIVTKHKYKVWLPHIENVSMAIGHLYGEGLWTKSEKRTLKLS